MVELSEVFLHHRGTEAQRYTEERKAAEPQSMPFGSQGHGEEDFKSLHLVGAESQRYEEGIVFLGGIVVIE